MLAGAVYGFVTEGVLTSVAYGGYPFDPFAISYTSLAWHAVVSVGFGLVVLHRLLVRRSAAGAVAAISLFGGFWGVWAMTLRLPPGADDEPPGLSLLVGHVELGTFAVYTAAATAVVGACHLLLGRFIEPADLAAGPVWRTLVVVVGAAWFALLVVPAAPWATVELAVLLTVGAWGLARLRAASPSPPLAEAILEPIPPRHLGRLAALPVAAVATHATLLTADLSEHAIRVYILVPVVATQTLLGWALFLAALAAAWRNSRRHQPIGNEPRS
jgi:hypothetical protein